MNVTKIILDGQVADIPNGGGSEAVDVIPSGLICMWSGSTPPDGWALCDGTNNTPDLRGRFVLGSNTSHVLGTTGGSETVVLTISHMPSHTHVQQLAQNGNKRPMQSNQSSGSSGYYDSYTYTNTGTTNNVPTLSTGNGVAHENMPPYYTLAYIMKL